jgi:hypothetical protein
MATTTPGITAAGLVTERYPEARARVVTIWRSKFGQNSPTGPGTENGLIIDVIALMVALMWESVAGVHSGSFFRSAVDRALDMWVDAFGFERIQPTPSSVVLTFYGDAEATIPALLQTQTDAGTLWATLAEAEFPATDSAVWIILVTEVLADDYVITADDVYTVSAVGDETLAEIAQQLVNEASASAFIELTYAGDNSDGLPILVLRSVDGAEGMITVEGPLEKYPGVEVDAECTVDGPTLAVAGSIIELVTASSGVVGVINEDDAIAGALEETNATLKRRFLAGQGVYEKGTARAVESALLRLAQTYELAYAEAHARENVTAVEVDGVPPHAIAPLVYMPGIPAEEIAAAILATKANGYQSFGDVETVLLDSHGDAITIGHTNATEAYLHVQITILVTGEAWPSEGEPLAAIEAALADDATGTGWLLEVGRLQLGVDLYRLDLHGPIIEAVGVGAIKSMMVELATTPDPDDTPAFADDDLTVDTVTVLIPAGARVTAVLA